jgi:ElaB/YqjD/DUF883 family membrane-anchored ribosome-binding protein
MDTKNNSNSSNTSGSGNSGSNKNTQNTATAAAHGVVDRFTDAAESAAHKGVETVSNAAGATIQWASGKTAHVQEAGQKLAGETSAYVAAEPWKSLAIALVVGILIGKVVL